MEAVPHTDNSFSPKHRILIAEDNDNNYLLLWAILNNKYSVFRAKTGIEVVDLFIKEGADLILMDIKMPILDGLSATKKIRETGSTIPIIAVTAYAFDSDVTKSMEAGCTAHITKPVNSHKLAELLDKYLPD